jgi:hypothetical protein
LHHAKLIEVIPALYDLSLLREPEDTYARDRDLVAGRSDAPELALVGATHRPTGHYLVPFGDHILDCAMKVGEGPTELAYEPLDILGSALLRVAVRLMGDVSGEDLVHQVQVPLVTDLFDVAPESGLFSSTDILFLLSLVISP